MAEETRLCETPTFRHTGECFSQIYQGALKVYLAHNFYAASFLREVIAPILTDNGMVVCSTWIQEKHAAGYEGTEQYWALRCLEEVVRCDVLLIFQDQFGKVPGRGKYVEFGYALARNKPIIVIGAEIDCIFYYYPRVMRVKNFEDALEILKLR